MSINNVAHILEPQGHYVEAEVLYLRAIGILEQTLGPEHPSLATALNNLAVVYLKQGRLDDAEKLFQRALDIRQTVLGNSSPEVAVVANNLAQVYQLEGRQSDAEAAARRAIDILPLREETIGAAVSTVGIATDSPVKSRHPPRSPDGSARASAVY